MGWKDHISQDGGRSLTADERAGALQRDSLDPRYLAFDMFLEKPKVLKVRKKMTARVVT